MTTVIEAMDAAGQKWLINRTRFDQIINGDDSTLVATDNGQVRSFAMLQKEVLESIVVSTYPTLVALGADLTPNAGKLAFVTETGSFYIKVGASGTGSWEEDTENQFSIITMRIDSIESLLTEDLGLQAQANIKDPTDGSLLAFAILDVAKRIIASFGKNAEVYINGLKIIASDSKGQALALLDRIGRVIIRIGQNGHLFAHNFEIGQTRYPGHALVAADQIGRVLARMTNGGEVTLPGLVIPDTTSLPPLATLAILTAYYMSVAIYGQSNSLGYGATPVISDEQPYNNKTLLGGVRTINSTGSRDTLIPLVETVGSTTRGETPASGTVNELTKYLGGASYTNRFVAFASGQAAQPIANLMIGTDGWNRLISDLQAVQAVAVAEEKTHCAPFWTFTQGEGDYNVGTDPYIYMQRLLQMQQDYGELVNTITGQGFRPPLILSQVAAHRYEDYAREVPTIALAQWWASKAVNDIIIAAPAYVVPIAADNLHYNNYGALMMGAYYALAAKRFVFDREPWRPLEPKRVFKTGASTIDIEFNVPYGVLEFDTTWVAPTDHYGFGIHTATNVRRDIITAVTLVGTNTVRLTVDEAINAGDKVTYAWGKPGDPATVGKDTGPRGNLRDQQANDDRYVIDGIELNNYCLCFEWQI